MTEFHDVARRQVEASRTITHAGLFDQAVELDEADEPINEDDVQAIVFEVKGEGMEIVFNGTRKPDQGKPSAEV